MSVEHVRAFDARRTENERLYLLLDPLTDHDETGAMAREALAQRLGDDALVTVWRKDLAHTATTCPILVDLGSDPTEERDALLAVSAAYAGDEARRSRRYVAGWLISALEPEALAGHIASMYDMTDAAGQSHFFPIHEPLRLELLAVAERDYARQQLGPIREWLLPASGDNFVLLTGAGEKAGSMPLTRVALEAQQEAPHVATVLAAWRAAVEQSRGRGAAAISDSAARDAFVQIRRAKEELRLSDHGDVVTFALYSLVRHSRLYEHPEVAGLIARSSRGESALADLFTAVGDPYWDYIVGSLNHARTARHDA